MLTTALSRVPFAVKRIGLVNNVPRLGASDEVTQQVRAMFEESGAAPAGGAGWGICTLTRDGIHVTAAVEVYENCATPNGLGVVGVCASTDSKIECVLTCADTVLQNGEGGRIATEADITLVKSLSNSTIVIAGVVGVSAMSAEIFATHHCRMKQQLRVKRLHVIGSGYDAAQSNQKGHELSLRHVVTLPRPPLHPTPRSNNARLALGLRC